MNIDDFIIRTNHSLQILKQQLRLNREPVLVLIVHEAASNPCSERVALIKYFNNKGIECQELKYPIGENYEN